jgi:transcriptional regulator with XRE-family HTH domain
MMRVMARERTSAVGELLRQWRETRKLSQLELASLAEVSARHVSFLETGRSAPSRDMVLHLADRLEVPMRERNRMLLAAGFAPHYPETPLDAPQLSPLLAAAHKIIRGHEPDPALVVDGGWNIVAANRGLDLFTRGAAPEVLGPPINALRLALHPKGMAPRIANLPEWRAYLLHRLRRRVELTADERLAELHAELVAYPSEAPEFTGPIDELGEYVIPLRLIEPHGEVRLFCTTTVFGTAQDITVAELAIEQFFPG